jgi:superfamily I DNA and/or RNA helicase
MSRSHKSSTERTADVILTRQLRPKVNHYDLTVEKGEGFDLNRSLFERLVLQGYPHQTLVSQHRMRPEISSLIRHLTYPDLTDAPRTSGRPNLRGVTDNIVFIDHIHPEDDRQLEDRRDMGSKMSKQNTFEIWMVLKIVRYLVQQGYKTEELVVLTPYLGQLQKLREALKQETDPVLNDLDMNDLIRAGAATATSAKHRTPLRLATIG